MTADHTTRRSHVNLGSAPIAALLAATLLGGAAIGALITQQLDSTTTGAPVAIGAAARPALTFDAVKFRAEERAGLGVQVPFDDVTFRAEERAGLEVQVPFDAVKFRAEERAALEIQVP